VNRRAFVTGLGAVLAAPLGAEAQQARKRYRIGFLSLASEIEPPDQSDVAAFREGLRVLGYAEGENLVIEQRYAAGRLERLPELAAELVRLKVDVLVTYGSGSSAKQATRSIPIVFIVEPDPVGTGLVASLARPGANITGLADAHADLVPKRLELLKEVVPSAARVGVLLNPARSTATQLKIAQTAASALGLTVFPVAVTGPGSDDLDRAFATMGKEHPGALLVIGDPTLAIRRNRIAELAIKRRLPTSGTVRTWAEAGLLMAYGTNFIDVFRHAATYVDKILKGAQPGDLPVEQPTKFELVINLKTAKALGLTIPPSLLLRADQVIE
jgi:putative tryptophan/tyrosine transport system substrate-binding protein